MKEKTIADWEMESRHPTTNSSRVDDWLNRTSVDSTEVGYKPVGWLDSRQSQETTEEQGETVERRQ